MTLENIQAIKTQLENTYFYWGAMMREFPRSDMGLIPDDIRESEEYKRTKAQCDKAFTELRAFNGRLTNTQKRELAQLRRVNR